MAIANASMLDEATAAAEAMTLCHRHRPQRAQPLLRRRRRLPADAGRRAHARANRSGSRSSPGPRPTPRRPGPSRSCSSIPARTATCATIARSRPPCMPPAGTSSSPPISSRSRSRAARRMGRRCRRRLGAALRRADGLRRPACRLPRDARRLQALDARTARRRDRRRQRRPGVPPRAADARAAHPPREGDVEHLHGAGAAGGDRRHVRRLPRPGGLDDDRAARASADRDPEGGSRAAGPQRAHRAFLRHDRRRDRGGAPRGSRNAASRRA